MGYGIIQMSGKRTTCVTHGFLQLNKHAKHAVRLKKIFDKVVALIDAYHPDELSIEAPFYGKNVQSMLKLGRAQGVAIAAALSRDIPYCEYAPRRIKQAITGNGNASKEQVAAMLQTILGFGEMPNNFDATDGLAAAVCHSFQDDRAPQSGRGSWKAFLAANPKRRLR